jgi:hypothetical protein
MVNTRTGGGNGFCIIFGETKTRALKNWKERAQKAELIKEQKIANELLREQIRLQKHGINNDCAVHSSKKTV